MVGTAGNRVGCLVSMVFSTSTRLKRGSRISSDPVAMPRFIAAVMANTWKKGITHSIRSPFGSTSPIHNRTCSVLAVTLAWVSIAPFGIPVVPPVYCSNAMSCSGSISTGSTRLPCETSLSKGVMRRSSPMSAIWWRLRTLNNSSLTVGKASLREQTTIEFNVVPSRAAATFG